MPCIGAFFFPLLYFLIPMIRKFFAQGQLMASVTVCKASELPVGNSMPFKHNDEKILVYHLEDGFYATQGNCTHLFMPLKNGKIIEGCRVRCPFHRAEFDIKSGEVCEWANFPPGIQLVNTIRKEKALKTYNVAVEEGEVKVDFD